MSSKFHNIDTVAQFKFQFQWNDLLQQDKKIIKRKDRKKDEKKKD